VTAVAIERVGVVVPARDEQDLLPSCLDALEVAVERLTDVRDVVVDTVVVLDRCTDASLSIARARDFVTAVEVGAGNVGLARGAGCAEVLRGTRPDGYAALWLASTDADSQVPPTWLLRQVELAEQGVEVVLGTVTVDDWSDHPPWVEGRWRASYNGSDGHPHVHGANVGCRADAYLAAGGFLALSCDEDIALATALADRVIVRTGEISVVTSARRTARAAGGFADYLAQLG
jgi:glycosyltransferase involved in cell wall biosynthesis